MRDRLWMTRTLPNAHKSAGNFERLGLACTVSPLLTIVPTVNMPPPPDKESALVFTSANGLNWFCEFTKLRHWPVVTVGDETAAQARGKGFKNVSSASGTSEDVTELIKSKFPVSRPIIHCSGKHIRGTITKDLHAAGFTARRDIYYESNPVLNFPKLDVSKLSYVALYSPLAAQTLQQFAPELSTVTILSISAATDAALGSIKCQTRLIASAPNETAMLALLGPSHTV